MLSKIDGRFAKMWSPVVGALCRITRQSSFALARIAVIVAASYAIGSFMTAVNKHSVGVLDVMFYLIITTWVTPLFFLMIHRLEKAGERGDNSIPLNYLEVNWLCMHRVVFTIFAITPPWPIWWKGYLLAMAFASYAMTDFHPKRPSFVRKVIKWLKAQRPRIHRPLPAPSAA